MIMNSICQKTYCVLFLKFDFFFFLANDLSRKHNYISQETFLEENVQLSFFFWSHPAWKRPGMLCKMYLMIEHLSNLVKKNVASKEGVDKSKILFIHDEKNPQS